eukprot:g2049.t1
MFTFRSHGELLPTSVFKPTPLVSKLRLRRVHRNGGSSRASNLRRHYFPSERLVTRQMKITASTAIQETSKVDTCPRGPQWQVHKFGGTCMATAERMRDAAKLVLADPSPGRVVIVSAMGSHETSPVKVTDLILRMLQKASQSDQSFTEDLESLQEKHIKAAKALLETGERLEKFLEALKKDISNLTSMLQAIAIAGTKTEAFSDFVVGHGELWSARLFASVCQELGANAGFMDARDILVVNPSSDKTWVDVDYKQSNEKLDTWASKHGVPDVIVATGFIARNRSGRAATLRRNGSDFSATIFGALFNSSHITIWTDVDGVYSADPRKVKEAFCLKEMTYNEAWELSYFGANVLHPRTTLPALKHNIPITLRNFFNIKAPGTQIKGQIESAGLIKGFSTIDNVAMISVEGTGMAGVPGIAARVFSAMRDAAVNVIIISQGSSEQSICFAVKQEDGNRAVEILQSKFAGDIEAGNISNINCTKDCTILAAVGKEMANKKGMAAMVMSALAAANVNIKAIAQGSSEYNITVLIKQEDSDQALQAVHSRFYLSKVTLGICLIGPGLIGSTLLEQLNRQRQNLKEEKHVDIRVLGIADVDALLLDNKDINLDNWKESLKQTKGGDLDVMTDHLANAYVPNKVIVDCTASDFPPEKYLSWIEKGIHVITPNKKLGAGPLERYRAVRQTQRESYTHWLYETTVGAGLPVIATLKHLRATGDKVLRIEGIFSGTLSYIFNELKAGIRFSEVVKNAKAAGFTEPDPRDDLEGMDVARKVTILARECGIYFELDSMSIDSLVPPQLKKCSSAKDFMAKLHKYDKEMSDKVLSAEKDDKCLRYVGIVDCESGTGRVKLAAYPKNHPFAQLEGSDNIISFVTERYFQNPLIVRGPGAGAAVTAAGVFSDLLRLADYLGAPS